MNKRIVFLTLTVVLVLSACVTGTPAATPTFTPTPIPSPVSVMPVSGMPQGTGGYSWWNDTTFYEIFVRSFYDSNGDGIGDFNGITEKLDYLQSLGITGLWLMPINPSPSYHGYDVTDYYAVNPDYGTMDDFKNLLNEAHKRGMRVILDLVLNHTSSQHPWFQQAADPKSPYHDWYIWSDTDPGYLGPWGEQVWYPLNGKYYYAIFWDQMPDLNYRNPAVTAEMDKVTKFWLDLGVDGFRLDAAKHLVEDRTVQADSKSTHAWLQDYYSFYKSVNPNAITVGELSGDDPGTMAAYINNKQLDLAFDFGSASAFVSAANTGNAGAARGQIILSYKLIAPLQFATFLTNHDQDRLMTQLAGNDNKVKVAASLLLTAPGVPFLYYGEEVGLKGGGQDELKRRPMQWSADANAGFSTASPWEPVGLDFQTYNVAAESNDPNSILAHYQALIHIRSQHAALRVGDLYLVTSSDPGLYAILRISHENGATSPIDEAVLVLINLTNAPIGNYTLSIDKSPLATGGYHLVPIMGAGPTADLTVASIGDFSQVQPVSEVPAYGTLILQLQAIPSGK
ncbi:MAG TPA: alpha-amylase family glycosyl hydrolase [Anaerolineales bacterium]|nr:alpha-amylase family glycosyl hydrolase [Anaerolineales bacterium]